MGAQVPTGKLALTWFDAVASTTHIATYDGDGNPAISYALDMTGVRAVESSLAGDAWLIAREVGAITALYRLTAGNGDKYPTLLLTLAGAPRDMLFLDNGDLVVLTTTHVLRLPPSLGTAITVSTIHAPEQFVDLAPLASGFAALSATATTARVRTFHSDGALTGDNTYAIPFATSFAAIGAEFVVGTATPTGILYRINGSTASTGNDPPARQPVKRVRVRLDRIYLINGQILTDRPFSPMQSTLSWTVGGTIEDLSFTPDAVLGVYGSACAGTTAAAPVVGSVGRLRAGNTAFSVTLSHAPANALAVLCIGTEALAGSTPLPPGNCYLLTAAVTSLGRLVQGDGTASVTLPTLPAGIATYAQWLIVNPDSMSYNAASAGACILAQ